MTPTRRFVALIFAAVCAAPLAASENERPRADLRAHLGPVYQLRFNHDGSLLASVGSEGAVFVWDVAQRRLLRKIEPVGRTVTGPSGLRAGNRRIEGLAFAPQGDLLVEAADESPSNGMIRIWNAVSGDPVVTLAEQARNIRAVAYSPDGKLVAANMREPSQSGHKIALYDAQTGKPAGELLVDRVAATLLAFSPDGSRLVSAGGSSVCIWDVAARSLLHRFDAHKKPVRAICISPDGELLATCAGDDLIRIWKLADASKVREIEAEQEGVNDLAFSRSGRTLASAGDDHTIKLWEPSSGLHLKSLWAHLDRVLCLEFSPDGATLASGSADRTIALWDFSDPTLDPKERRRKEKEAERREKEKEKEKEKGKNKGG